MISNVLYYILPLPPEPLTCWQLVTDSTSLAEMRRICCYLFAGRSSVTPQHLSRRFLMYNFVLDSLPFNQYLFIRYYSSVICHPHTYIHLLMHPYLYKISWHLSLPYNLPSHNKILSGIILDWLIELKKNWCANRHHSCLLLALLYLWATAVMQQTG